VTGIKHVDDSELETVITEHYRVTPC